MLNILASVTKAAVSIAVTPLAVVADAATLGGVCTQRDEPYTATALNGAVRNLEDAIKQEAKR